MISINIISIGLYIWLGLQFRPSEVVKEVYIKSSKQTVEVEGKLTCKSNGGCGGYLYVLESTKPEGLQYAGLSCREQPVSRFREHRTSIMNGTKTVGEYFAQTKATTDNLKFTPFMAIKSDIALLVQMP